MIEKFTVTRDDAIYEAFPDVALAPSGKLVCVFLECTHHGDRGYTRVMQCESTDRGRTWSPKRALTEALNPGNHAGPFWNCPRIVALADGRLAFSVDRANGRPAGGDGSDAAERVNFLAFSEDEGASWSDLITTPIVGIVPDRLVELKHAPHAGRWVMTAHIRSEASFLFAQCWISDDRGRTWRGPVTVARKDGLHLCEGSIVELPPRPSSGQAAGPLVCFLRENSFEGYDAYKTVSEDGGESWSEPVRFPLPACHRPVAGVLASGRVLITHRFMQGGQGWAGWWTQNTFAALTDVESCLAADRRGAHTRIMPLDFDRSCQSDTGYTGWVQLDDGEIIVVNYCLDDAPKGQIRCYALREEDFLL